MDDLLSYATVMAQRVTETDEASTSTPTALVFGRNLSTLMTAPKNKKELGSNQKLARKTGLATSSLSRLRNGKTEATLETIEKVAKVFQVEPWQLLVPNLQADNLPALQPHSEQERRLWERLREVAEEIKGV